MHELLRHPARDGPRFRSGASGIGPTAPFSASTLNWANFNTAANSGTNGTQRLQPLLDQLVRRGHQTTGTAMTVDQRLTSNVSFYGEAFWSMRRATFKNVQAGNQLLVGVPTFNPYYPIGGPNGLRVAYNINIDSPSVTKVALCRRIEHRPARQLGDASLLFDDAEYNHNDGNVSKTAVSAALGWTLPITPAIGTTPAIATWTKPTSVPYLNLFCDAT